VNGTGTYYRLRIFPDGRIDRPGIYTPRETRVVERTSMTITFKIPGHTYWRGIGQARGYAPVEYVVCRIIEHSETSPRVEVTGRYSANEWRARA